MKYLLLFLSIVLGTLLYAQDRNPFAYPSIYISTNQGDSWQAYNCGLPDSLLARDVMEVNGYLYLLTSNRGLFRKPLSTPDSDWQSSSAGLPADAFITSLWTDGDRMVLSAMHGSIYISDDGGNSWRKSILSPNADLYDLHDYNGQLLLTSSRGVYSSPDKGESWFPYGNFQRVNSFYTFKDKLIAVRQNSCGIIEGQQATWSSYKTDWAIVHLTEDKGYLYARTAKGRMIRSKDGLEWEPAHSVYLGVPTGSLMDILWAGYRIKLPSGLEAVTAKSTPFGWIAITNSGC